MTPRFIFGTVLLALLAGCTPQGERVKTDAKKNDADAEVRQVFADFQAAVKARDGARLWELLAADSQQDADRKAQVIRADYGKADEPKKAELAKNLDLPAGELKDLDGKGYLKSKQFFGK